MIPKAFGIVPRINFSAGGQFSSPKSPTSCSLKTLPSIMNRQNLIILSFLILCSCRPNSRTKNEEIARDKDKKTESTEKVIDNEFTKIVLSLCDEVYNNKFTNQNTEYFDLNILEDKECFVFASELVCGGPMGSCGRNIEIYKRIGEKYEIVFRACGFNIDNSKESSFGYLTFTYDSKDGIRSKVYFNGQKFIETPILVNNLDFNRLKVISKLTNYDIRSFVPVDYNTEDNVNGKVKIEKIKIGKTSKAELYTVSIAPLWYFLFYSDSLIFSTSDILSFETIIDDSKVFYDIRTYSLENYVMRKDTSYLVPTIYKYSRISKKYEKNSK
jgi:hypothetical protein